MKKARSIISVLFCLALCLSLCCPAFAGSEGAGIVLSLDKTEVPAGTATTMTMSVGTDE